MILGKLLPSLELQLSCVHYQVAVENHMFRKHFCTLPNAIKWEWCLIFITHTIFMCKGAISPLRKLAQTKRFQLCSFQTSAKSLVTKHVWSGWLVRRVSPVMFQRVKAALDSLCAQSQQHLCSSCPQTPAPEACRHRPTHLLSNSGLDWQRWISRGWTSWLF